MNLLGVFFSFIVSIFIANLVMKPNFDFKNKDNGESETDWKNGQEESLGYIEELSKTHSHNIPFYLYTWLSKVHLLL